jgi:hypothetical protein
MVDHQSASECVRELLERIAAGVGVDARVPLEEDAEGVSAKYLRKDQGPVIGQHRGHEPRPSARRRRSPSGRWTPPHERRGDSTAARPRHHTSPRRPGSACPTWARTKSAASLPLPQRLRQLQRQMAAGAAFSFGLASDQSGSGPFAPAWATQEQRHWGCRWRPRRVARRAASRRVAQLFTAATGAAVAHQRHTVRAAAPRTCIRSIPSTILAAHAPTRGLGDQRAPTPRGTWCFAARARGSAAADLLPLRTRRESATRLTALDASHSNAYVS